MSNFDQPDIAPPPAAMLFQKRLRLQPGAVPATVVALVGAVLHVAIAMSDIPWEAVMAADESDDPGPDHVSVGSVNCYDSSSAEFIRIHFAGPKAPGDRSFVSLSCSRFADAWPLAGTHTEINGILDETFHRRDDEPRYGRRRAEEDDRRQV